MHPPSQASLSNGGRQTQKQRTYLGDGFEEHIQQPSTLKNKQKKIASRSKDVPVDKYVYHKSSNNVENIDSARVKRRRVIHNDDEASSASTSSSSPRIDLHLDDARNNNVKVGQKMLHHPKTEANPPRQFNFIGQSQRTHQLSKISAQYSRPSFSRLSQDELAHSPSASAAGLLGSSTWEDSSAPTTKSKPSFLPGPTSSAAVVPTPTTETVLSTAPTPRNLHAVTPILPEAFSPHRRKDRFIADGWASQLRSWVIEASSGAGNDRSNNSYYGQTAGKVVRVVNSTSISAAASGNCAGFMLVRVALVSSKVSNGVDVDPTYADDTFDVLLVGGMDETFDSSNSESGALVPMGSLIRLGHVGWDLDLDGNAVDLAARDRKGKMTVYADWRRL